MRPEKFESNINPTSDGFDNFYDRSAETTCHDVSADLSVGFQLLLEVELYWPQSFGWSTNSNPTVARLPTQTSAVWPAT